MWQRKNHNVVPIRPPMGRWQLGHLLVAVVVLAVAFGTIYEIVATAKACDRRGGILARGAVWFVCVDRR